MLGVLVFMVNLGLGKLLKSLSHQRLMSFKNKTSLISAAVPDILCLLILQMKCSHAEMESSDNWVSERIKKNFILRKFNLLQRRLCKYQVETFIHYFFLYKEMFLQLELMIKGSWG